MISKILIIDDEESILFVLQTHLSNQGHEVLTAKNYALGLKAVSNTDIDLIITDVALGTHTGIDILREVRKRDLDCPVIIITGSPNVETKADATRLGAFDYLSKPVRKETLVRVASQALQHKTHLN